MADRTPNVAVAQTTPPRSDRSTSPDTLFVTKGSKHAREPSTAPSPKRQRSFNLSSVSRHYRTPSPSAASPVTSGTTTSPSSMSDTFQATQEVGDIGPNWPLNKPHVPGYHPNVTRIEEVIRDTTRRITKPFEEIKAQGFVDEILGAYVGKLTDSTNSVARSDDIEVIALQGDMGIGKSEAYEALIGQDGIAIKSDSGRGTHFPIEARGKTPGQEAPFLVVVVWKVAGALKVMVKRYCHDIFAYLDGPRSENELDDELDDSNDEADEEEAVESNGALEREHLYNEALQHLLPLLYNENDIFFKSREALSAFFKSYDGDHLDLETITRALLANIMALRRKHGLGASTNSYPVNTAKEAMTILEKYSPPTLAQSEQVPRWEVSCHLQKAIIHSDNDMGTEGIVFTDVPGRNDPDVAMGEMVEEYIQKEAKRYLVMAPAGRPVTKESDRYLRDAIRSKRPTIFVVTKIDVKDNLSAKERAGLAAWELEIIVEAESHIDALKTQRLTMESDKAKLEANGKYQEATELARAIKTFSETELHKAEATLHQLRVETRNRKEEAEIHAQYHKLARSRSGSSDLQVVFISAKEYGKHRRGEPTMLDYEATGIPKLFRLLYRDVASKRIQKLQRLCRVELPRHISVIQQVLNKTPIQRHQDYKVAIKSVFDGYAPLLQQETARVLLEWIATYITAPFELGCNKIWPKAGVELLARWTHKVPAPTFHKFCKLYGDHVVRGSEISWNADIQDKIAGAKGGVADGFNGFLGEIEKAQDNCFAEITRHVSAAGAEETEDMAGFIFRGLNTTLRENNFHAMPMSKSFLKEMKAAKLKLRELLETLTQEYMDTVETIKNDTIVRGAAGKDDESYVGLCMAPTYDDAKLVDKAKMVIPSKPQVEKYIDRRGKEKERKIKVTPASMAHDLRKKLIRMKLAKSTKNNKSVFEEVHQKVEADIKEATEDFLEGLDKLFSTTCASLLDHFDAFYLPEGVEEEHDVQEMTASLREVVARVLDELPSEGEDDDDHGIKQQKEEGVLEKLLRECESWKDQYPLEQQG